MHDTYHADDQVIALRMTRTSVTARALTQVVLLCTAAMQTSWVFVF